MGERAVVAQKPHRERRQRRAGRAQRAAVARSGAPEYNGTMFGPLGFQELALILVLALLIFGPKKLPEIGRTIGKGMAEFRRATSDLKRSIQTEVDLEDRKPSLASASTTASSAASTVARESKSEEPKDD
jgi:TatA/E family protein of Tat protein translocase